MKLYFTPTSPFVRKVLAVAHECNLASQIETITLRPSPTQASPELSAFNPLSKIPALITNDGMSLFDSAVICEYLDSLHSGTKMIPTAGPERWKTLRMQALCDGILEAGVLVFYEKSQRPVELHWQDWLRGQTEKALQGLDALNREVASFRSDADLGQICAAATIGWLEFRNVLGDIRQNRPQLFDWYETFRRRPSMKATEPHA